MSKDKDRTNVARKTKITALLESHGMKATELARKLRVPASTVHYWTTGAFQPRSANLVQLCEIFDVDASELVGYVEENASAVEAGAAL